MSPLQAELIIVVGRGHSGTRMLSHTLYASGVFMGKVINDSGDALPPQPMYEACDLIGEHVGWSGGLSWDFQRLHEMPIDPRFEELVQTYLKLVLEAPNPQRGWKLPETTLAYPWIVRMFPNARYVHIVRDPRDCLLKKHRTDNLADANVRYPDTGDELDRRVASWKYQHDIVRATPAPKHFLSVRYEDLVLDYEHAIARVEAFLGIPLARIVVDRSRVGQWRSDRRLLPHVGPLAADIRELGYEWDDPA